MLILDTFLGISLAYWETSMSDGSRNNSFKFYIIRTPHYSYNYGKQQQKTQLNISWKNIVWRYYGLECLRHWKLK